MTARHRAALAAAVAVVAPLGHGPAANASTARPPGDTPAIAGIPEVGGLLTAVPGRGLRVTPLSFEYVWHRCDHRGAACTEVLGARQPTHALTTADSGGTLRVTITAKGLDYRLTTTSAPSPVVTKRATVSISSLSIRRRWFIDALRESVQRPLLGHGVAMYEDDTPEARAMGVAGQRIYPHNSFVEAAHALGAPGLLALTVFLGAAGLALVAARRSGLHGHPAFPFVVGVALFAFVRTNISGEIGADALLWVAAALAVGAYLESRTPRRDAPINGSDGTAGQ